MASCGVNPGQQPWHSNKPARGELGRQVVTRGETFSKAEERLRRRLRRHDALAASCGLSPAGSVRDLRLLAAFQHDELNRQHCVSRMSPNLHAGRGPSPWGEHGGHRAAEVRQDAIGDASGPVAQTGARQRVRDRDRQAGFAQPACWRRRLFARACRPKGRLRQCKKTAANLGRSFATCAHRSAKSSPTFSAGARSAPERARIHAASRRRSDTAVAGMPTSNGVGSDQNRRANLLESTR